MLRPLRNGLEVLRGDVFDEERLFRLNHGSDEMRAISIERHLLENRAKRPPWTGSALATFSRLSCPCSSMTSTQHQSAKSRTTR